MLEPLDYASPQTPPPPIQWLGDVAMIVGVASAAWMLYSCTRLAAHAQVALLVPTDCGTGRHAAESELFGSVVLLTIPGAAVAGSYIAGSRVLVCRCSLWCSIFSWLMSFLFVEFR